MQSTPWPLSWSAIWAGAITALAAAIVFGLIGAALGAAAPTPFSWHQVAVVDLIVVVLASFWGFAIGGWVCGKVAGFSHSEPSILHAALSWAIGMVLVVALAGAGAGSALGGWYGGLAARAGALTPSSPETIRNGALAALTSLLIGLIGAVIGGWLATGEPMTFTHHLKRRTFP